MRADAEAEFRRFVAGRSPALLRTAYLLVGGDWALAEDLLQAALVKTYLAWGRIEDRGAVERYVRRTMATTATSWWRRRWTGEQPTAELPERTGRDEYAPVLDRQSLWAALRRLPRRQRAVIVLRFFEDLSEAETAAMLGTTVGTVKSQTWRALARLRVDPTLGPHRPSPNLTSTASEGGAP